MISSSGQFVPGETPGEREGQKEFFRLVYKKKICPVEPRLSGPRLSGLFLWSQFGHEYLLVTIKIRSHILFETTALKCAVKGEGFFALKEQKQRSRVSQLMKNIRMSSDWLRVALLPSEISHSMACSALHGKDTTMLMLL